MMNVYPPLLGFGIIYSLFIKGYHKELIVISWGGKKINNEISDIY